MYICISALSVCGGKSCVANAHCFNYKCVCDTGYVGSGYSKCESKILIYMFKKRLKNELPKMFTHTSISFKI